MLTETVIVAPGLRPGVGALGLQNPLGLLPVCGQSVLEYWLTWIAEKGVRSVLISASDRYEMITSTIGDGSRWGLEVQVQPETTELTPAEAASRFRPTGAATVERAIVADYLPDRADQPLFRSYATWFAGISDWIGCAMTPDRVGIRELRPGVFVSMRAKIAKDAELMGPCWIGEGVFVGARSTIGPYAILENRAYVESDTEISLSQVGPETFVGRYTVLKQSLAWEDRLISWKTGIATQVQDAFMLSSMADRKHAIMAH